MKQKIWKTSIANAKREPLNQEQCNYENNLFRSRSLVWKSKNDRNGVVLGNPQRKGKERKERIN